jgi:outer membrane lipoprotein SlyB
MRYLAGALLCSFSAALALSGCEAPTSGSTFTTAQAQQVMVVELGVVDTVRPVTIQPGPSGIGAITGGALGGIAAASNIGRGTGSVAAGIGGAVLGGAAGNAVEQRITQRQGLEIVVRLDSGQLMSVVQDADQQFFPGDRVRVLLGNNSVRVARSW